VHPCRNVSRTLFLPQDLRQKTVKSTAGDVSHRTGGEQARNAREAVNLFEAFTSRRLMLRRGLVKGCNRRGATGELDRLTASEADTMEQCAGHRGVHKGNAPLKTTAWLSSRSQMAEKVELRISLPVDSHLSSRFARERCVTVQSVETTWLKPNNLSAYE
jgi:hypothetical protein